MLNDLMTQAWQPRTPAELSQPLVAPKQYLNIQIQDGYQHQPWQSGDSRDFASDTHPEDTWN